MKLIGSSIESLNLAAIENGVESNPRVFIESDVLARLADDAMPLYTMTLDTTTDFWRQIKTGSSVLPANKLYLSHFQYVY
jgi:NDP-sugar pyrophosphorylase family protein